MNINEVLKSIDSPKLRSTMNEVLSGKDGKEISEILKSADKEMLLKQINRINANGINGELLNRYIKSTPNIADTLKRFLNSNKM